jgi:hypothetical protein
MHKRLLNGTASQSSRHRAFMMSSLCSLFAVGYRSLARQLGSGNLHGLQFPNYNVRPPCSSLLWPLVSST